MLGWLALIVTALIGLFIRFQNTEQAHNASTFWLAGIGFALLVVAFYLATLKVRWSDARSPRWPLIGVLCLVALGVGGAWIGKDQILLGFGKRSQSSASGDRAFTAPGPVSVLIRRDADGKYLAYGHINAAEAAFLFDTGSSAVMLKNSDAEKAGIDVTRLTFTTPMQTANGTIYAAPVRLRSVGIGLVELDDVEALVAKPGSLNENLLGMSFLRRLESYDLSGEFLILRQ
jgi:aspartyl protease family protein